MLDFFFFLLGWPCFETRALLIHIFTECGGIRSSQVPAQRFVRSIKPAFQNRASRLRDFLQHEKLVSFRRGSQNVGARWPGRQVGARPSHRVWLHTGPRGHKACHLEARTTPRLQHCPAPGCLVPIMAPSCQGPCSWKESQRVAEGPGLGRKSSKS